MLLVAPTSFLTILQSNSQAVSDDRGDDPSLKILIFLDIKGA